MDLNISPDDPRAPDVARLLTIHLAFAREWSLPEDVHVLDADQLVADDVFFFTARRSGELVAVGALRHLDAQHAEIKSMHTVATARGQGVGKEMLDHLVTTARVRSYLRISLETGLQEVFAPARRLYRNGGFEVCQPFGDYQFSSDSIYMTRNLT
ncbi:MAG: GNAT family N-acetyltransferase [Bacillota bacterium]|nr:MAG: GNAT family N-acetyltransferase [Planctomycetota bacterium]RUA09377.1 MAG: GNAT family N-acetyltransferase [Bacillota bacterium]